MYKLLILAFFISSCGGGDGLNNSNNLISGYAIDGYLKNSTVCLDINDNSKCDIGEDSTTTNENGYFSFTPTTDSTNKSILVVGGTDIATSKIFSGTIKKVVDSSVDKSNVLITPITTLIHNTYKKGNSLSNARQTIATALGLDISKIDGNPMIDKDIFAKTQKIIQSANILVKNIESDSTKNSDAFNHIIDNITDSIITENNFDISQVITKLESVNYGTKTISITTDVENTIKDYADKIASKTATITDVEKLDELQFGFEEFSTKIKANLNSATAMTSLVNDFENKPAGSLTITWYKPNKNTTWQWQLKTKDENTALNTSYNVDVYDIDLFDTSKEKITAIQATGKKVICYFSGGSFENWRDDKDDFPESSKGNVMSGWETEKWLYINDAGLKPVMSWQGLIWRCKRVVMELSLIIWTVI
jgi:hypothetical protein